MHCKTATYPYTRHMYVYGNNKVSNIYIKTNNKKYYIVQRTEYVVC